MDPGPANPELVATYPTQHHESLPSPSPPLPNSLQIEPPNRPRPGSQSHSIRLTATIRTQPAAPQTQHPTNNNNGEFPQQTQNLFQMRDRLFLALFFRASLIYARTVPKVVRRILEFMLLMQSLLLLFALAYIHIVYTQTPITCLKEYKELWPKDGILRVDITTESPSEYTLAKSYLKEERLRLRNAQAQMGQYSNDDLLSMMLTADSLILDKAVSSASAFLSSFTSSEPEESDDPEEPENTGADNEPGQSDTLKPSDASLSIVDTLFTDSVSDISNDYDEAVGSNDSKTTSDNDDNVNEPESGGDGVLAPGVGEVMAELSITNDGEENTRDTITPIVHTASGEGIPSEQLNIADVKHLNEGELLKVDQEKNQDGTILNTAVHDLETVSNSVWLEDHAYIVEYSLEYGFLRLSSETRERLNISVKLITLDPHEHSCFGNNLSRFFLDHFLGYDDILMSSIKNLAETEDNKGYLRNVVTGEQFRFVSMWMARSAYLPALLIMLVFTVSISMLLRYSHHQIFVFIVDLLNNVEGNGAIHVPAAPLFTVILALVGMEAIMSEFFNDTSTAFYVILIVWIADQYDSVCCLTNVTRTYWVRFFYLYHFVFYAYHYRFNGQYGGLALLTSWSFIQHSMVYFYHHYELPAILRQAHQGEEPRAPPNRPFNPPAAGAIQGTTGVSSWAPSNSNESMARPASSSNSESIASTSVASRSSSATAPSTRPDSPARYNITTVSAELTYTRTTSTPTPPEVSSQATVPAPVRNEESSSEPESAWHSNPMYLSGLRQRNTPSTSTQGQAGSTLPEEGDPLESEFRQSSSPADELD